MSERVFALTTDGRMTYCSAPIEKRGVGRCNHILHQEINETKEDFLKRCQEYDDSINSENNIDFHERTKEDLAFVREVPIENVTRIFDDDYLNVDSHESIGGSQWKTVTVDGKYIKKDDPEYTDGIIDKAFTYTSAPEAVCSFLIRNSDVEKRMRAANYYMSILYDEDFNQTTATISPSYRYLYETEYTLAPCYGAGCGNRNIMRNDDYRNEILDGIKKGKEKEEIIINAIIKKFGKGDKEKLRKQFETKCALDILFQNADILTNPGNFVVIKNVDGEPEIVHMDYGRCLNFGLGKTFLSDRDLENFDPIKINIKEMKKEYEEMKSNMPSSDAKYMVEISFDKLIENLEKYPKLWVDTSKE